VADPSSGAEPKRYTFPSAPASQYPAAADVSAARAGRPTPSAAVRTASPMTRARRQRCAIDMNIADGSRSRSPLTGTEDRRIAPGAVSPNLPPALPFLPGLAAVAGRPVPYTGGRLEG